MTAAAGKLSVQAALAAVMTQLDDIPKNGKMSGQSGGYAYRKIEDITNAVKPLFAKHGITFVPRVLSWDVREIMVNNKPWTDTTVVVEYTITGPDGSQIIGGGVGIGRDNSDKGANKAMSQAFKYCLTQTLCIADQSDDADNDRHVQDEQQSEPAPGAPAGWNSVAEYNTNVQKMAERLKALPEDKQAEIKSSEKAGITSPYTRPHFEILKGLITRAHEAITPDTGEDNG